MNGIAPCGTLRGANRLGIRRARQHNTGGTAGYATKTAAGPRSLLVARPQQCPAVPRGLLQRQPLTAAAAAIDVAKPDSSFSVWVKLWNFVSMAASCLAAATAVAFVFTQQVKLLAGPILLPLLALVASREAQRCLAQERFTRVLSLADTSSQLERVLASMRQLGQQLQQSGEAPKLQFLSLESKVSVLEGSILSAGSRVQAAARIMETAAAESNTAVGQKLDSTAGSLRALIAQQHQAIDHNLNANMQELNGSMQDVTAHLDQLAGRQGQALEQLRQSLSNSLADNELVVQECFRTQVQRYLEPLTRLPELMARSATVLPIVDASPPRALPTPRGPSGEEVQGIVAAELQSAVASLMDAQASALETAAQRPAMLADSQWSALGSRLATLEHHLQDLAASSAATPAASQSPVDQPSVLRLAEDVEDQLSSQGAILVQLSAQVAALQPGIEGGQERGPLSAEGTAELAMQVQQIAASMAAMQGQLQQLSLRSAEAASAAADTASASLPAVDMGEQLGALLAELSALKGVVQDLRAPMERQAASSAPQTAQSLPSSPATSLSAEGADQDMLVAHAAQLQLEQELAAARPLPPDADQDMAGAASTALPGPSSGPSIAQWLGARAPAAGDTVQQPAGSSTFLAAEQPAATTASSSASAFGDDSSLTTDGSSSDSDPQSLNPPRELWPQQLRGAGPHPYDPAQGSLQQLSNSGTAPSVAKCSSDPEATSTWSSPQSDFSGQEDNRVAAAVSPSAGSLYSSPAEASASGRPWQPSREDIIESPFSPPRATASPSSSARQAAADWASMRPPLDAAIPPKTAPVTSPRLQIAPSVQDPQGPGQRLAQLFLSPEPASFSGSPTSSPTSAPQESPPQSGAQYSRAQDQQQTTRPQVEAQHSREPEVSIGQQPGGHQDEGLGEAGELVRQGQQPGGHQDEGLGEAGELVRQGVGLLRQAQAARQQGADLGETEACLQQALAKLQDAAAQADSHPITLGNLGRGLLLYGQHKQATLAELMAGPPATQGTRFAVAQAASKERLVTEARAALTRAGQLFRSVAQSTGEGQPQGKFSSGAQRALVQWSRALCARAALADEPQDAEELYESAVGKLRAVLSSNPGNQAAERACGLALLDWGTQAGLEPQEAAKHLQEAHDLLRQALADAPGDEVLSVAFKRCEEELSLM